MKVHIFGFVCSPAVCAYVLSRAAEDADAEDVDFAIQEVKNQFYVDSWVTSFRTEEEAGGGAAKLTRVLKKGGFELAQWGSSSRSVLESLPGQSITALSVDLGGLPTEQTLGIPRCYCSSPYREDSTDLIMFSDASEKAFGAVGYLRFELLDGTVKVAFVLAKAKVAPVKYVSMPRLELCGCLVAVRMAKTMLNELRIRIRQVILFTDSTTNSRWFNSESCRFTPYVANRVGEILESFGAPHWRYVPTLQNPADDVSRGVPAAELTAYQRFFTGPFYGILLLCGRLFKISKLLLAPRWIPKSRSRLPLLV
jgi:hypothetical protein